MMRANGLLRRFLCLALCLVTMILMAMPAAAKEDLPELRPAVAVHYRASEYSAVIGYLENDTKLTVLDSVDNFHKIDCYDMVGYISKNCVRLENGEYYVNSAGAEKGQLQVFGSRSVIRAITLRNKFYDDAVAQVGVRYVSGGSSPRGFDCSGFTSYVYRQSGITIPRTCEGQLAVGIIIPKESLQCGDLVLFSGTTGGNAITSHVGMYLGDGKLIHAGSGGITIVDLDSRYFAYHYLCSRRIVLSESIDVERMTGLTDTPVVARYVQTRGINE